MVVPGGDHLAELIADVGAVAARLAAAAPTTRGVQAAKARRESARLSARLDASPLTEATADAIDERELQGLPPVEQPAGAPAARVTAGWAQTWEIDALATQEVAGIEYANLLACFDAEAAMAPQLLDRPREALAELHVLICRGLVEPGMAGRPRETEQAVHDGAQGRVLYRAAPPERLDGLLDELAAWLTGPAEAEPALIVAGTVHERILRWQPFEAGNGRVARAASRLVLRARKVDPEGLAVAERLPARDPLGYHRAVAANMRRRALDPWLEWTGEAVLSGLIAAADAVDPDGHPDLPPRAAETAAELEPGAVLTLTEYAERTSTSLHAARTDLRAMVIAGRMEPVPGSRGLRFSRRAGGA